MKRGLIGVFILASILISIVGVSAQFTNADVNSPVECMDNTGASGPCPGGVVLSQQEADLSNVSLCYRCYIKENSVDYPTKSGISFGAIWASPSKMKALGADNFCLPFNFNNLACERRSDYVPNTYFENELKSGKLCDQFKQGYFKEKCYKTIAEGTVNEALCEYSGEDKELCYGEAGLKKGPSVCDALSKNRLSKFAFMISFGFFGSEKSSKDKCVDYAKGIK